MLFTDLLPALLGQHPNGVPMPLGGPMLSPMAKSPSNATVTPTLGAHNVPPALDPASLLNAATNAQLKDLESQKLAWQIGLMKDFTGADLPGLMSLYGPGGVGGGTTMPGTNGSSFGGELPPAPSRTGAAAAGWGPLADPAVSAMKSAGASDAFIQAAMGHGLAEGGFQQPWAKAGGGENSFGHWQFNKGGELPGYEKFAAATGPGLGISDPTDTRLQAMYLMQRADQLHPGITKTDDPNQAMDVLGTKFERYKGNAPGQRRDYLAAAQRALAVPDVPTADLGGAGTRYGAAFGGSTTPLADTMATAINPIQVPPAPQIAAAIPTAAGAPHPARIGLSGNGPNAQMINMDTGEPVPPTGAPTQLAQAGPGATSVTPLGGSAQPAAPTQAPPAFGTLAPGGMPNAPPPGANPQMVAAANMLRKAMAYSAAGLPVGQIMAQSVYNSPAFKAAVAGQSKAAEMGAAIPYLQETARQTKLGEGTPYSQAVDAAKRFPVGSPERAQADAAIAKAAGISPVIGGERPGVPIQKWNSATGQYDIIGQVPRTGEGQVIADTGTGEIAMAPNAERAIEQRTRAEAAGPAAFRKEDLLGPYGRGLTTSARNLPDILAQASVAPAAPGGGTMRVGPSLAPATQAVAPAPTPGMVQTPAGTKDISQLTLGEMFPGGLQPGAPGITAPPTPPPGMTYGKPGVAESDIQKEDGQRASTYAKEAANNQRIYLDLQHIQDVLKAGVTTSRIAPIMGEFANIAQGLGLPTSFLPQKWNPNDIAVIDKAATDLIFEAVKKLPGQVRVAEIEGYTRADPGAALPVATNMSILNDILAQGKWQDARARLASEFITSTGGAPLASFDARFNALEPLADASERLKAAYKARPEYKNELARGIGFPEDLRGGGGSEAAAKPEATQTLNGQTYVKIGGTWHLQR